MNFVIILAVYHFALFLNGFHVSLLEDHLLTRALSHSILYYILYFMKYVINYIIFYQ